MDTIIANLKPGQSTRISDSCHVERSGNGRIIRFVRETKSGFVVYRTCVR